MAKETEFNLSEKRQDRKHPNPKLPFNNEFTYPEEDVKEFIQRREARLRNQIRIHWNWLKEKSSKEVADFIIKIANAEAGDKLTGSEEKK